MRDANVACRHGRPIHSFSFFFFGLFSFFLSFLFCCWISWARSVFYIYKKKRERERNPPRTERNTYMYICIDHGGKSHKNKSFIAPGDFPSLSLCCALENFVVCVCWLVGFILFVCVSLLSVCVCVCGRELFFNPSPPTIF